MNISTGEIILAHASFDEKNEKKEKTLFIAISDTNTYKEFKGVYVSQKMQGYEKDHGTFLIDNSNLERGDIELPLLAIPSRMATIRNSSVIKKLGKINLGAID